MAKNEHEIRDPIHNFIRLESSERKVLDSRPMQRLRHIHQLGTTFLVYPGATHRRFEHSLGVMELASRVYDVVMRLENIGHDPVKSIVPDHGMLEYWRRTLRMAALCHDLGHLPFSHAAEAELLPEGWDHERLTIEIIKSNELTQVWKDAKVDPEDVARLAVGPMKYPDQPFSDLEALLSEIIVGDAFGVDRMDYLLRDSHHAGVAYGKFDHYRLIDSLRILPRQWKTPKALHFGKGTSPERELSEELCLGLHEDGIHGAEALMLARYFMYTQLYFHPVRRAYDIHLKDFLTAHLNGRKFSTAVEDHLRITDNEIMADILKADRDVESTAHKDAQRLVRREHFRRLWQRNPEDVAKNPEAGVAIFKKACEKFGEDNVRHDRYTQKGQGVDFPVFTNDGRICSSQDISAVLAKLPPVAVEYVLIAPSIRPKAKKWLIENRDGIIAPTGEEDDNGTP